MINWKVRIKNKAFWVSLIPAVLLLIQVIAAVFGYTLDLGDLGNKLLAVVNALFAVLAILGVVTDPTTAGVGDSAQALTYTEYVLHCHNSVPSQGYRFSHLHCWLSCPRMLHSGAFRTPVRRILRPR